MKKPKAIIYDWDGTLVDSLAFIRHVHNQVRVEFGLEPYDSEEAAQKLIRAASEVFPEIYGDRWKEAYDRLYVLYDSKHLQELSLMPGAVNLIKQVHSMGFKQGVASNKRGLYLRPEVVKAGLEDMFAGCVFGAGDVAKAKPAPDMLLKAADFYDLEPAQCWYVGDTESDMLAAQAAGMYAVFIGPAGSSGAQISHMSLTKLQELLAILEELH